jgi:7,8-dihydropterin-6-yl-methyl-4-(beta-D-ribofuranosyl)aminobenzene 5'-phosphate synthase
VLGRRVREQALILRTGGGLVVVTGCAHPGITRILECIQCLYTEQILLLIGGFHLEWALSRNVRRIVTAFRDAGVRFAAPTHCSGEKARSLFQREYGSYCLDVGLGRTVALDELTASSQTR